MSFAALSSFERVNACLDFPDPVRQRTAVAEQAGRCLSDSIGLPVAIVDLATGADLYRPANAPTLDAARWLEMGRTLAERGQASLVEDEDPLLVCAIPFSRAPLADALALVATTSRPLANSQELRRAAGALSLDAERLAAELNGATALPPEALERLAGAALARWNAEQRVFQLQDEVHQLSRKIGSTFEEISLIYRLTQNLKLSGNFEDLARQALDWLSEVVSAEGYAIQLLADEYGEVLPREVSTGTLVTYGNCPLNQQSFSELIAELELEAARRPVVINRGVTGRPGWNFPSVQQMILVPLAEGSRIFGWLAVFNQAENIEFGTIEASLLSSVGTILGIHTANLDLYQQQAQTLADVVRAMSSAIDAKDPYTRGHSDRVARIAVRLAQDLGCDQETVKTIYLSGLLHDIGKIGIDDNVLRKPGRLTTDEFEHVKTHVVIGYRILKDLRKMGHMLPVVLHHHESWDGTGYPHALKGNEIPFLARIVAVADAYDAMASDRPYRQGMPDGRIDDILRKGAGVQWDANVVDAFFRCRDDIREISRNEIDQNELAALQWT